MTKKVFIKTALDIKLENEKAIQDKVTITKATDINSSNVIKN